MNLAGSWRAELRKLLLVLAASAVLGYLSGYALEMLALGLATVTVSWLWQLWRMRRWLEDPDQAPPEATGIWGLIYDTIYGLQRENREARGRLQSTVDYLRSLLTAHPRHYYGHNPAGGWMVLALLVMVQCGRRPAARSALSARSRPAAAQPAALADLSRLFPAG